MFFFFVVVCFLLCSLISHVGYISGRLGVASVTSHMVHVSTQNAKHLFTSKYEYFLFNYSENRNFFEEVSLKGRRLRST